MGAELAFAMGMQPGGGQGSSQFMSFLPIILIFVIFYFLLFAVDDIGIFINININKCYSKRIRIPVFCRSKSI
jgi:hypothetical protein